MSAETPSCPPKLLHVLRLLRLLDVCSSQRVLEICCGLHLGRRRPCVPGPSTSTALLSTPSRETSPSHPWSIDRRGPSFNSTVNRIASRCSLGGSIFADGILGRIEGQLLASLFISSSQLPVVEGDDGRVVGRGGAHWS
jgi:hypothetical protein